MLFMNIKRRGFWTVEVSLIDDAVIVAKTTGKSRKAALQRLVNDFKLTTRQHKYVWGFL